MIASAKRALLDASTGLLRVANNTSPQPFNRAKIKGHGGRADCRLGESINLGITGFRNRLAAAPTVLVT